MGNAEFIDLLRVLQLKECITQEDRQKISEQIITDEGLKLLDLIVLFSGSYGANDFLCSLPIDLKEAPSSSSAVLSFTDLIAIDFTCETCDGFDGWRGVRLISFKIKARKEAAQTLTWTFPFGLCSSSENSRMYLLTFDGPLNVNIEWPVYSQRSTKGHYRGILKLKDAQNNTQEIHIVGELSTAYEQAPLYTMTFADSSYATDNYTNSIDFLLASFNLPASLQSGINDVIKGSVFCTYITGNAFVGFDSTPELFRSRGGRVMRLHDQMTNVGFVLEKTLSNVSLKEIGADVFSTKASPDAERCDWWPFPQNSFLIKSLRAIIRPIEPLTFSKIFVQLDGSMAVFRPAVPFKLLAGASVNGPMLNSSLSPDNHDLTIQKLLDTVLLSELLDVGKTFPSVSNLTNSTPISTAELELRKGGLSSFHLRADIDDWKVIPGTLEIAELSVDIYSTFTLAPKQIGFSGNGVITINGFRLGVGLEIQGNAIAIRLLAAESLLTLRSILDHFFHQSNTLFPQTFPSILDQMGIENIMIEGSQENDTWSLSHFSLSTAINLQLDISDNFSLTYPKVVVNAAYPFTANQRINVAITAVMELSNPFCETTISWTGADSNLNLMIQPISSNPLSLHALICAFLPKGITLSVPPSVSSLLRLGLANAQLTLSKADSKFTLTEMSATIVSTSSLILWTGLELTNLHLSFSYCPTQENSKSIILHATLEIADKNLDAVISYGSPTTSVATDDTAILQEDSGTTITAKPDETWAATVTYDGKISILDIMSSIAKVDLRNELSSVELSALRDMIDIELSNLKLVLARQQGNVSFVFDAHVDYLFFNGLVHLACAKSASWTYSFMFGLSPEKFLLTFGIQEALTLTDTVMSLNNTATSNLSIGFKTTLILQGIVKNVGRAINAAEVTIAGSVSDRCIDLTTTAPEMTIFNHMSLIGSLIFSYLTNSKELKIAIQGTVSNISFPQISSEIFATTFSLFVKLPNPELGFACTIDKLTNAFGLESLNFQDLLLSAAFQEFPVPSEVCVTGAMELQVDDRSFTGSLAIYFSEFNLTQSGVKGNFETFPTLNQALRGFDPAQRIAPKAVDGTFIALEFSQAAQEVTVGDVTVNQGLYLKGDLNLPSLDFEAFFEINIAPSLVHVSGHIKDAITVEIGGVRLFALTSALGANHGPELNFKLETKSITTSTCHASTNLFILGFSSSIELDLYDDGFRYDHTFTTEMFTGGIKLAITKTYLDLHMTRGFELSIPSVKIGDISIQKVIAVEFDASFSTKVDWSNVAWNLKVQGHVIAGNWDLGTIGPVTVAVSLSDFKKIATWLENFISEKLDGLFKLTIGNKLVSDGLKKVIEGLDTIGLDKEDIVNLLTKEFDCDLGAVMKNLAEVFEMDATEVAIFLKSLGHDAEEIAGILNDAFDLVPETIATILKDIGFTCEDIGRALSGALNLVVRDVFNILKDIGYAIDDVTRVIKVVFCMDATKMAEFLKSQGYSAGITAKVLYDVFDLVPATIATILKFVGFPVDDIVKVLSDGFGLTVHVVSNILKSAGYATNVVERVIKDAFGNAVGNIMNTLGRIF